MQEKTDKLFFSPERLENLIDGVFSIVMTLMVFDIKGSGFAMVRQEDSLYRWLFWFFNIMENYFLSFLILAFFWYLSHYLFNFIERIDGVFIWLNMLFMMFVTLIPFCTDLAGRFPGQFLPRMFFGADLCLTALMLYLMWKQATGKTALVSSEMDNFNARSISSGILAVAVIFLFSILLYYFSPSLGDLANVSVFIAFPVIIQGKNTGKKGVLPDGNPCSGQQSR